MGKKALEGRLRAVNVQVVGSAALRIGGHDDRSDVKRNGNTDRCSALVGCRGVRLRRGPKWWHWGSFIVLTVVLFIPLAMAFFIPLPIVVILNVAISHSVWMKKHGTAPGDGITALR